MSDRCRLCHEPLDGVVHFLCEQLDADPRFEFLPDGRVQLAGERTGALEDLARELRADADFAREMLGSFLKESP